MPDLTLQNRPFFSFLRLISLLLITAGLTAGLVAGYRLVSATNTASPPEQPSPLHPDYPLLDSDGINVLESGKSVSTIQTCGACHDAEFITQHSYHASAGLNDLVPSGQAASGRPWDISPGFFGTWNAIEYRYLSPAEDQTIDLTTPAWIQVYGIRHVGGGPAVYNREGIRLTEMEYQADSLETNIVDPQTGELVPWNWEESGVVEMNCFLCHIPEPDNQARIAELQAGRFRWANTATLGATDLIQRSTEGFQWNESAFTDQGEVNQENLGIQDPRNENCGLCHGLVHDEVEDPLVTTGCSPERWSTITTGQIISPQKMADTGMNLENKEELDRSWDVHAERLLDCTDCHYSLNNPLYYRESESTRPPHLSFDPRRIEIGQYLLKPLHQFARGNSAQSQVAPQLKDTMRNCQSCHSVEDTHTWLPYKQKHLETLSCETCHIPKIYSSANRQHDWTVLDEEGNALKECRGVAGEEISIGSLLTGYQPVLLPMGEENTRLQPFNLITTWYWVQGDPPRPVHLDTLQKAYLEDGTYHPGVLARFDANHDQQLDKTELRLDKPEKVAFLKLRLEQLGVSNPRIAGEVQPYSINHTVAASDWALRDCKACHSRDSRLNQPIPLSSYTPAGIAPQFIRGTGVSFSGELTRDDSGTLYYQPQTGPEDIYVLGLDNVPWVDLMGTLLFFGVLLGVIGHGGLRVYAARMQTEEASAHTTTEEVYMYGIYERLWHWLQTAVILLLLVTGLIIHRPDTFGIFSFRGVVIVHNVMAAILIVNAGLSLFYHLATGEIQQYIPHPQGFFDRSISQAVYYVQGIFKGREHPFEKTPQKKLNPLQQITYFGLLNILLPLQIITGALMWGAQRWPELASNLGGLPFLAPFHTLIAWLFAAFILLHVYLTTTGHTPLASLRAMILGWEEVQPPQSESQKPESDL